MKKEFYNTQGIIFIDSKNIIDIRGHFTKFICATVTTIEQLVVQKVIKGERLANAYRDDYVHSILKIENKSDYNKLKAHILWMIEEDNQIWSEYDTYKDYFKK